MLELKREIGQVVKIGSEATLTVDRLNPHGAESILQVGGVRLLLPMFIGKVYHAYVDSYLVHIHMVDVVRGEAVLGFDADRRVAIDRAER